VLNRIPPSRPFLLALTSHCFRITCNAIPSCIVLGAQNEPKMTVTLRDLISVKGFCLDFHKGESE